MTSWVSIAALLLALLQSAPAVPRAAVTPQTFVGTWVGTEVRGAWVRGATVAGATVRGAGGRGARVRGAKTSHATTQIACAHNDAASASVEGQIHGATAKRNDGRTKGWITEDRAR